MLEARPEGLASRLGDNNIFSTLARHEALFRAWLPFAGFLLGGGVLPARERELLILRTGCNCGSPYEWGQHVRISERLDIDRETIMRVAQGPGAAGWSEADATLLRAADELHGDDMIGDATYAALAARYDAQQLLDVVFTVGQYHLVSMALNTLRVQRDDGVTGVPLPERD